MNNFNYLIVLSALVLLTFGCSSTYALRYPQADRLFVTAGDDPGSESLKPYLPKGTFIHVSREWHIPLPILGLIIFGNAEPKYVWEKKVLPQVVNMGGDAITNINLQHNPRPGFLTRLFGIFLFFKPPSQTIIIGQVVKK